MATERFKYHVGDTGPRFSGTLKDSGGTVVDLTGASLVFQLEDAHTGVIKVAATAGTVVSASAGTWRYDWGASDLDTAGEYHATVTFTDANSDVITQPQDGYYEIHVQAQVS